MEKVNQIVRMRFMSFAYGLPIIVIGLSIAVNCTPRESKQDDLEHSLSGAPKISDTCKACSIDSFYVKRAFPDDGQKVLIDGPVAVQFFNQVRLADKYEVENYDTLMKLFKMKHTWDRSVISALKNQYFYFVEGIKPILIENSIKVVDSVSTNRLLEFRVSNGSIFVNPADYIGQDGVLFFLPGKEPVFWTADREEAYCKGSHGLAVQYFLCSPQSK